MGWTMVVLTVQNYQAQRCKVAQYLLIGRLGIEN